MTPLKYTMVLKNNDGKRDTPKIESGVSLFFA